MDELRHEETPVNCEFISFGIAADLNHLPENIILPLKEPVCHDGKQFKSCGIRDKKQIAKHTVALGCLL